MDSTKKDYRAIFMRFGKMFLCLALCLTILLNACRTNETRVNAVAGVDDAAFAAVGLTVVAGMVICTALVACGVCIKDKVDYPTAAAQVWKKLTDSEKQEILKMQISTAALGSVIATFTANTWLHITQIINETYGSSSLLTSSSVSVSVPTGCLAFDNYLVIGDVTANTTPSFICDSANFTFNDSGITYFIKQNTDYSNCMDCDIYIPSLQFRATFNRYPRSSATKFFLGHALSLFAWSTKINAVQGFSTSNIGAESMNVGGNAVNMKWDTAYATKDTFTVQVNGQDYPGNGAGSICPDGSGITMPGHWLSWEDWWNSLRDLSKSGYNVGHTFDAPYYPGVDQTLNPTDKETDLVPPATLDNLKTKTAADVRDTTTVLPTTSTAPTSSSTNTSSDSSSNSTSSSPASIMPDGTGPVLNSLVGDTSGSLDALKKLIDSIKDFFAFLAKAFSYVPAEFWVLIIAALVVVIILRVLGR